MLAIGLGIAVLILWNLFTAGGRHTLLLCRDSLAEGAATALPVGIACALTIGEGTSLVTLHLSVEFLDAVHMGQWVEITAESTRPGRTIAFASAEVTADGASAGRATALFRVIAGAAKSSS